MKLPKHEVEAMQITELKPNQVFVFGSNLAGRHGKGAAKHALKFGAIYGFGVGHYGQTYAIATKDGVLNVLPLYMIAKQVAQFLRYALDHHHLEFLVTPIGCGLAGYSPSQIRPFFQSLLLSNVKLPDCFK